MRGKFVKWLRWQRYRAIFRVHERITMLNNWAFIQWYYNGGQQDRPI